MGKPPGDFSPPSCLNDPPGGKDWIPATSPPARATPLPSPPEKAFHCKAEQLQGLPYGGDAVEVCFSLLRAAV